MSLYDRNYASESTAYRAQEQESAIVNFVKTTYKFFGASVLFATIGAFIGMNFVLQYFSMGLYIGLIIAEFALLFGLMFLRDKPGINVVMLFGFTFITGVTLTPLIARTLGYADGVNILTQALLMTTIIFGVMSFFALRTTKDLANMGKMLFVALIVVMIVSIVNLFLGSSLLHVIISGVGAVLFSLYIAYDTQNIIRGRYDSPIMAAISLYLDVLNLFVSLLNILNSSRE